MRWPGAPGGPANDGGTILPLVAGFFVLAGVLCCGAVAASAAFLAQRDLASVCDGAAVAAAGAVDDAAVYRAGPLDRLPLDPGAVAGLVRGYLEQVPGPVAAEASVTGDTVTVRCARSVRIPFGPLVGYGDGLPRLAVARARAPLRG